jgi:hypothetical protein
MPVMHSDAAKDHPIHFDKLINFLHRPWDFDKLAPSLYGPIVCFNLLLPYLASLRPIYSKSSCRAKLLLPTATQHEATSLKHESWMKRVENEQSVCRDVLEIIPRQTLLVQLIMVIWIKLPPMLIPNKKSPSVRPLRTLLTRHIR